MFEKLFTRRGLSLDRLRSFLEVVEAGSIVRAVDGDPVRQSQYSRQISELEAFFGIDLVQRKGKRLEPTPKGRDLARAARVQLQGLHDFLGACERNPQLFRIGGGDSLLQWVVVPLLPRFQALFPRTQIHLLNLRSPDIAEQLNELGLDFGVARRNLIHAPLKQKSIGSVHYAMFIPRQLLQQETKRHQRSDRELLEKLPWVTLGSDGEFMRQVQIACDQHEVQLNFKLITQSFPQAARAIRGGTYAAILPLHSQSTFNTKDYLIRETSILNGCSRKVSLAWNPKILSFRPGAEQVLNFLREHLRLDA